MTRDPKAIPEWSRPGDGPGPEASPPTEGSHARHKLDRYELIARIASGGMGMVFLARLEGVGGFQRLVAIKLMHPHLAADAQFIAMFLDEARLAARIHHPNAVSILDVCSSESGYYLVMEYVEGFTLDDILDLSDRTKKDIADMSLRILVDASAGLHAAHELKGDDGRSLELVHRDVSPQNILVGVDGVGRITDFGVARAAARITASRPGMIKGKPCYMAPEQARGEALDRRADVFALGIILWEILTGEQLFWSEAGEAAMLVRVMYDPIDPPSVRNPEIHSALDAVTMKALNREPEARYQTAREFTEDLEQAARAAGCLISNHNLADRMKDTFREDIRARRASIQRHIEHMGEVTTSDVYNVPQLSVRPSSHPPVPGPSHSPAKPLTPTVASAPAALPSSPAPVVSSAVAAPSHPATPANTNDTKSRKGLAVGLLALLLLGVAAVAGVWALLQPNGDATSEGAHTAEAEESSGPDNSHPPTTRQTRATTETDSPESTTRTPPVEAAEPELPAGAAIPTANEARSTIGPTPPDPTPAALPPSKQRARSRRSTRMRRERPPPDDTRPTSEIPVEANPYF